MELSAVLQGAVFNTSIAQRSQQKPQVVALGHGSCSLLHCREVLDTSEIQQSKSKFPQK